MYNFYTYLIFSSFIFLYLFLGQSLIPRKDLNYSSYLLVGLIFSCLISLFLRVVGFNIYLQLFLPFLMILFRKNHINFNIKNLKNLLNFNYLIWFVFNYIIATSIISFKDGIATKWINNYGDLAFHLGIIHSFVFGDNPIPEYHVFPGEILSYPFFINYWSAMLWSLNTKYIFLEQIFLFQWVFLWSLSYFFIKGNKFWILPWIILLGGGSLTAKLGSEINPWLLLKDSNLSLSQYSALENSYVSFLYKIWITQRSAVFGVTVMLGSLSIFFGKRDNFRVALAGILIASMALIHAHFALVVALFLLFYLIIEFYFNKEEKTKKQIIILFLTLSSGCIFLPWLIGKTSLLSISIGWLAPKSQNLGEFLINFITFWWNNASHIFILAIVLLISKRNFKWFVPLLVIFILANIFNISVWKWDQIKIFIALNMILFFYISTLNTKRAFYLHFILIIICLPSINIFKIMLKENHRYTIFSEKSLEISEVIKNNTLPGAIIAAKPLFNSPVSLSGRFLFLGYKGWLWSHGIDYKKRESLNRNFKKILNCKKEQLLDVCPEYFLFTKNEKRYWKINEKNFKNYSNVKRVNEKLYKIN